MRLGILTGGGDAPGLNAAIRAVATPALDAGDKVMGVRDGWAGMLGQGDLFAIDRGHLTGILPIGGTLLGSSRTNPVKIEGGIEQVRTVMERSRLDALVAIGGDDTLGVAARLAETGAPVVGVPKTMDNDLSVTEYCIGFDTAVSIVTEALDRLQTTAASHHRVMVVEVMGRDTGWVAVHGGLAGGADAIVIPEFPVTIDDIVTHLEARRRRGIDHSIIVVAEGVALGGADAADPDQPRDAFGHVQLSRRGIGERLAVLVEERTGFESRSVALGHTQRGGAPTAFDRIWATHVGHRARVLLGEGGFGSMPVVRCGGVDVVPIRDVVAEQKRVPRELYDLARAFS